MLKTVTKVVVGRDVIQTVFKEVSDLLSTLSATDVANILTELDLQVTLCQASSMCKNVPAKSALVQDAIKTVEATIEEIHETLKRIWRDVRAHENSMWWYVPFVRPAYHADLTSLRNQHGRLLHRMQLLVQAASIPDAACEEGRWVNP